MSWDTVKLIDISSSIQTGPFGSQLHQSDYSEEGIPVVMPKDLLNGRISEASIARVDQSHIQRLNRHIIEEGDILYSRRGDVGRCAFAGKEETGWLCGTGCLRISIDRKKANPQFVFFQLQKPATIGWVINHAVGATMLNLNTSILGNVPLDIPPIDQQNRIVDILSAYDDLIKSNQRQIKLLEEAAQRLYKEWFVDLRFPGHENVPVVDGVPEGWTKNRADSFFDITIGKTPPRAEKQWFAPEGKGVPWASIKDMGDAGTYIFRTSECLTKEAVEKHNMKLVPFGSILVSFKLTVGRVSIVTTPTCTNEAIAHFQIDVPELREYTYSYLQSFEYDTLGSTSSISKAVNSKIIKSMPFVMPAKEIIEKYSGLTAPLLNKVYNLQAMNLRLSEARDRLLPKLMSGEIAV